MTIPENRNPDSKWYGAIPETFETGDPVIGLRCRNAGDLAIKALMATVLIASTFMFMTTDWDDARQVKIRVGSLFATLFLLSGFARI